MKSKMQAKTRALQRRLARKETPAEKKLLDILTDHWRTLGPSDQARIHRSVVRTVINYLAEKSDLRQQLSAAFLTYVRGTVGASLRRKKRAQARA